MNNARALPLRRFCRESQAIWVRGHRLLVASDFLASPTILPLSHVGDKFVRLSYTCRRWHLLAIARHLVASATEKSPATSGTRCREAAIPIVSMINRCTKSPASPYTWLRFTRTILRSARTYWRFPGTTLRLTIISPPFWTFENAGTYWRFLGTTLRLAAPLGTSWPLLTPRNRREIAVVGEGYISRR